MHRVLAIILLSAFVLPALAIHHETAAPTLAEKLDNPSRADSDKARDAGRKPADVIEFLGITEGMTVMDLIAAGGYYTEVLSYAVGDAGQVYAQNGASVLAFRDGANEKAISARLADDRLPNVERKNQEIVALDIEPGSLDAVVTALNFHDIYNGSGPEAALAVSKIVFNLLKPGGVFGVIDHDGDADNDNSALHRMTMTQAMDTLEAAGFTVTASELLRNPEDTHDKGVFDPSVRGKTDRFLLKAVKAQ